MLRPTWHFVTPADIIGVRLSSKEIAMAVAIELGLVPGLKLSVELRGVGGRG